MSYLKRIIYNCRQATFLIDKKATSRLSLREFMELRIHLLGCSFCRIYKKQSKVINQMVHQLFQNSIKQDIKLEEGFKEELHAMIENELNRQ